MSLAVLLDAVCQGLEAPVLDTANLAAERFDNALVLFYECVNLLGGNVLPSKEDVFIKSHNSLPFLRFVLTRLRR
ncbi:hypothetical protein D3C80_2125130 [compost metagenome]